MSEAVKKTNQNSEGYSPKFPKIVQMMGDINETKIITDITKLTDDGGTKRLTNIRRIRNWDTHGDFMPPAVKMVNHEFREELAGTLREMGNICIEILSLFN